MDAVTWTAIAGVVVSIIVGIVVPQMTARRRATATGSATELVSWEKMNSRLQAEIDRQQLELDSIDEKYRRRFNAMQENHDAELAEARAESAALRVEMGTMRAELETFKRLLRGQPPLNP